MVVTNTEYYGRRMGNDKEILHVITGRISELDVARGIKEVLVLEVNESQTGK